MITEAQMKRIIPFEIDYKHFTNLLELYDINNEKRLILFFALCKSQSKDFKEKDGTNMLTYTANSLMRLHPKIFTDSKMAIAYAMKPMRLANLFYANKRGNKGEESGDGYKYFPRGYLMSWGKEVYEAYAMEKKVKLKDLETMLVDEVECLEFAMFNFERDGYNEKADNDEYQSIYRSLNGSFYGLSDFKESMKWIKGVLSLF